MLARWQKHPHLPPLLLWTLLWFGFFATLLLGRAYLPQSDLLTQFHAFAKFQAFEMLAGRLPLWSAGSYAGFPFAADTQAAVFYLPRWLTIFLSAPFSFSYHALLLEAMVHIWLLGVFTYLFAFDITHNRWAGLLAATAFAFGGYITSYPILQLAILETVTWLPLILFLLRRGVHGKRPLPWLLSAGLFLGLAFLAGHPQTFLHSAYLAAIYYLFLTLRARWAWRWIIGLGLLLGGIVVGVAAPLWLPALQYLPFTTRNEVTYEFVATGFALLDYLQLMMPRAITTWAPMYVGITVLWLALLSWLLRQEVDAEWRSEFYFWLAVAILTLLVSLGDKGVLFTAVYRIPGFSLFRQQERIVSLFSFSLAVLAALGFAFWQEVDAPTRQRALKQLSRLAVGGLLFAGFVLAAIHKTEWGMLWGQMWLITAVSLILLWRNNRINWRALGLVLLLTLDLFLLSRQQLNVQTGSPSVYWPQPTWLTTLQNDNPERIDTLGYFPVNVGELHNLQDIRGISPLKPDALSRFNELSFARRWQLLNVSHVVAGDAFEPALSLLTPIESSLFPNQTFTGNVYHYDAALPRAWLVYEPISVADAEAAFQAVADPDFDPATQVVLTNVEGDLTAVSPPQDPPQINIERPAPTTYQIQLTTETDAVLVVSEWHYPGWHAQLDGKSWPIETANYALQALVLPAGTHQISIDYSPWDVKVGMFVAIVAILFACVFAWRWRPEINFQETRLNWQPYTIQLAFNRIQSSQLQQRLILLLVLLLGFGLRIFQIGTQELRGDEAFSYLFARLPAGEIIAALVGEGDPHSPFHYLLLHGWMNLSGDSELAMRFIALLFSFLLIPLTVQLGRRLYGRRLGLLSAFWLTISASAIWLAQDVRNQYMLTLFFGMVATLILIQLKEPSHASRQKRFLLWGIYVIAAALTIYSHYYGLFILLAHGGYLWWPQESRWLRLGKWAAAGGAAALLFMPWIMTILPMLLAAGQLSDPSNPELAQYLLEVGIELTMGSDVVGWWPRWLLAATSLVVLLGALTLFKKKPDWGMLLTMWLGGALLFIYLIRFSRATFNSFYIAVAAPAWWLLFSVGFIVLWQQKWRGWRLGAGVVALFILGANGIGLKNYYFDPQYGRSNGYRDVAATITAELQSGDVFVPQFPDPVWGYYLRDVDLPNQMQPAVPNQSATDSEGALQTMTEAYDRIWFVPYASGWDSENVVGRWLDYHMLHEMRTTHQNLQLWAYRPLRVADEVTTPVDAILNEQMHLQSWYLTLNGQPVSGEEAISVTAGDALQVSLIWSAQAPVADDYTVFVHLVAEDGSLWAQHDGVPLVGTRPTTSWQVGERLLDRHDLQIGETGFTGKGRLLVGMYRADNLERLPFANGETALELAPVVVEP